MDQGIYFCFFCLIVGFMLLVLTLKNEPEKEEETDDELKETQRARLANMIEASRSFKETMKDIQKLQASVGDCNIEDETMDHIFRERTDSILERESELAIEKFLDDLKSYTSHTQSTQVKELKREIDQLSEMNIESIFRDETFQLIPFFSISAALASNPVQEIRADTERVNHKRCRDGEDDQIASSKRIARAQK